MNVMTFANPASAPAADHAALQRLPSPDAAAEASPFAERARVAGATVRLRGRLAEVRADAEAVLRRAVQTADLEVTALRSGERDKALSECVAMIAEPLHEVAKMNAVLSHVARNGPFIAER